MSQYAYYCKIEESRKNIYGEVPQKKLVRKIAAPNSDNWFRDAYDKTNVSPDEALKLKQSRSEIAEIKRKLRLENDLKKSFVEDGYKVVRVKYKHTPGQVCPHGVLDIETGAFYATVAICIEKTGYSRQHILRHLHGHKLIRLKRFVAAEKVKM